MAIFQTINCGVPGWPFKGSATARFEQYDGYARLFPPTTGENVWAVAPGMLSPTRRQLAIRFRFRLPSTYFNDTLDGQKVVFVKRSTNRTSDRMHLSIGGSRTSRWYFNCMNNIDNPQLPFLVDWFPNEYVGQWLDILLFGDLDDSGLVGRMRNNGQQVTNTGTMRLYITSEDGRLNSTLTQYEPFRTSEGAFNEIDFVGGYSRAQPVYVDVPIVELGESNMDFLNVSRPECNPVGGDKNRLGPTHANPVSVALICDTPGAVIRYTMDESMPRSDRGTIYTGPFTISSPYVWLRVQAFVDGRPASQLRKYMYAVGNN